MAQLILPRPGHRHVFTYDGLIVEDRIRELCPEPKFAMIARYLSKRWIINDEGVATVVPRRDFVVWGGVWEISEVAQARLEICMGVPGIYDRYGSFARVPLANLSPPSIMAGGTIGHLAWPTPTTSRQSLTRRGAGSFRSHI